MEITKIVRESFSEVLNKNLISKNISISELSIKSDLHRNTIGFLINKKRSPSLETVIKISNGLDMDIKVFISDFIKEFNKRSR